MKTSSKILIALGAGVAIGSAVGILFAPAKGAKTRKNLSNITNALFPRLKNATKEGKDSILALRDELEEIIELMKKPA